MSKYVVLLFFTSLFAPTEQERANKRYAEMEKRLTSMVRPIMKYEVGQFFIDNEFQKDFHDVSMSLWRVAWNILLDLLAPILQPLIKVGEWLTQKKELAKAQYLNQVCGIFMNAFTFDRQSDFEQLGEIQNLIVKRRICVETVKQRQNIIRQRIAATEMENMKEYINRAVDIEYGRNQDRRIMNEDIARMGTSEKKDFTCRAAYVWGYTSEAYYSGLNAAVALDEERPEDYLCYRKMIAMLCGSIRYMAENGFAFNKGILWRGMYVSAADQRKLLAAEPTYTPGAIWGWWTNWKDPFLWPGFISTSTDRNQALEFTCEKHGTDRWGSKILQQKDHEFRDKTQVLFKITVVPGYLDTKRDRDLKAIHVSRISAYQEEKEVLVYPYSEFWVEGHEWVTNVKCCQNSRILQINLQAVGRVY